VNGAKRPRLTVLGFLEMLILSVLPLVYLVFLCPVHALRFGLRRLARGEDQREPVFILASIIQWYEVWQRPQHFASNLSRKYKTCYISPVPVHHIVGQVHVWLSRRLKRLAQRLWVFVPLLLPGENKVGLIRALNRLLWVGYAKEAALRLGTARPVVWINFPFNPRLAKSLSPRAVVYDVMDEFVEFSIAPRKARRMEEEVLNRASFVSTGTYALYEKKTALHPHVRYIPCGVDFELFNSVVKRKPPRPQDFPKARAPVFGYFGTLNERIDAELIEEVARRRPGWLFVLIGPIQRSYGGTRQLGNVYYLGLKPYKLLPTYLAHFDVCTMPYRITEATKSISPVKLLEYFAAGKPVITTRIPDVLRFYESLVWVVDGADDFITKGEALLRMIQSGHLSYDQYVEVARQRSWEQMAEQMVSGIMEVLK